MNKYFLSLCCIIKNERYLEEFIIYYILQGIEHLYIYDNDSSNPLRERLNNFYFNKYVTVIDFPGKYKQVSAYNHCLQTFGKLTKWLIVVDGDEYILPIKNEYKSIRDFLNYYDDAQAIGINWIFFKSSFHEKIQEGFLIDKYRYSQGVQNQHIKTICKPEFTTFFHIHNCDIIDQSKYIDPKRNIISGPWNDNYTIDIIRINHYWGRSAEEVIEKYNRGNADGDNRINIPQNIHEDNNIIDNILPDRYLNIIKKIRFILGVNDEIYAALNPDLESVCKNRDDYYNHLINNCLKENRPLHIKDKFPNFNREEYRLNNPELSYLDNLNLELYYIKNN